MKFAESLDEFAAVDIAFGDYLARISGEQAFSRIGAELMFAVRSGHSCLPVDSVRFAELTRLQAAHAKIISGDLSHRTPLVLNDGRLYLHKYLAFENLIADFINLPPPFALPVISAERIRASVRFFAQVAGDDPQLLAVERSLNRNFAVITGGPGTGKTTVAAVILALELERKPELLIEITAPTGKAKSRMYEAMMAELPNLAVAGPIKEMLRNLQPRTVDSLLKIAGEGSLPYYNWQRPLAADLVIVDESSMVSLPRMAQLMAALKPGARLMLLGDKDQLSSIEIGSVFADICRGRGVDGYLSRLTVNRRSERNALLVATARQMVELKDENEAAALSCQMFETSSELFAVDLLPHRENLRHELKNILQEWGILRRSAAATVEEALMLAQNFKILCAVREGAYGVEHLNQLAAELLGLSAAGNGLPIMILENSPAVNLSNGDLGVIWEQRACFMAAGELRQFELSLLPRWECALAMTIHKSQGSGFDDVLMILPDKINPVVTRELVYTGLTRAKHRLKLWSPAAVLRHALGNTVDRHSGLAAKLG